MKRDEKNQQSRRRIIDSALQEFGEKGYGLSSINTICKAGGISKGIVYHHFKDKDDLYLACVQECFDNLTAWLQAHVPPAAAGTEEALQAYFNARLAFFKENPLYQRVFCSAVITTPQHLAEEIAAAKAGFDAYNVTVLENLLRTTRLRPGISTAEVVEIFRFFQDFANAHMQMETPGGAAIQSMEQVRRHLLQVLLYGVIERE